MKTLGRYPVLEEIGQGGFSTVYRGLDPLLDREVALKVMHPLLLSDPGFNQRFRREARALAALRHPQIIVIYEVAEAEGRLFIVMELAHGPSLAKYIAGQGQVPWQEVMAIVKPVCQALDYAHRQGVIHRDLKPSNILLDKDRGALLSDFGLARIMTAGGANMSTTTTTGAGILGTPSYIAPELWEFEASGPQSDIYSLGCIIFEMLTGKLLFNGQTPVQILRAHDRGPQFPAQWPEGVPPGVEEVLSKALAREPQDRYADALTLFTDLEDLEAAARSAQERARQTSAAEQWRSEARSAIQAGEWGAARMLVGRWLAVTPGDPEALAARAEIERRQMAKQDVEAGSQPKAKQDAPAAEEPTGDSPRGISPMEEMRRRGNEILAEQRKEIETKFSALRGVPAAKEPPERDVPLEARPQTPQNEPAAALFQPAITTRDGALIPESGAEVLSSGSLPPVGPAPVPAVQSAALPSVMPKLDLLTVLLVFSAMIAAVGLITLANEYLWTDYGGLMLLCGMIYLLVLGLLALPVPSLTWYRPKLYPAMMAFTALAIVLTFLLFLPSYEATEFAAPLIRLAVVQAALFILLLLDLSPARKRAQASGPPAQEAQAVDAALISGQKLFAVPASLQIGTREMWMIVLVWIILATWLTVIEWAYVLPTARIPVWIMRTLVVLMALYLIPAPFLARIRPLVRGVLIVLLLFDALIMPLAFYDEFGHKVEYWGFMVGRLAELALIGMLLASRRRDERSAAAAGNLSTPG